jgi:hypothetical protein
MRTLLVLTSLCLTVSLCGCNYDPVGQCVSRCEQRKADGCESASTDCDNSCVLADDYYEDRLERAQDSNCVSEYNTLVACYDSTPACASATVLAEMCGEEYLILEGCW